MSYIPKHLKRWTLPHSYFGATWEKYYRAGFSQNRDSDALTRSNFQVAWGALNKVSERVEIVRENHWAVGWVEWIAIPDTDTEALETADKLVGQLDYPVLNESHFSGMEQQEADEIWAQCYDIRARIEYIRKFRDRFEFRCLGDMVGCVRGKYFAGWASELIS